MDNFTRQLIGSHKHCIAFATLSALRSPTMRKCSSTGSSSAAIISVSSGATWTVRNLLSTYSCYRISRILNLLIHLDTKAIQNFAEIESYDRFVRRKRLTRACETNVVSYAAGTLNLGHLNTFYIMDSCA